MTTFLETLVQGAEANVQTWLLQQYVNLRAMPQTLAALAQQQRALAQLSTVTTDPNRLATLNNAGSTLQQLTAQYPPMIASVETAYRAVQQAQVSGVNLTTGAEVAIAVATAQQFTAGVSAVHDDLRQLIENALATGAITPSEASALAGGLTPSTTGWMRYALYAAAAYVAYRVIVRRG